MTVNKDELRRLAEAATDGDWNFRLGLVRTDLDVDGDGYIPIAISPGCKRNWRGQRDKNMAFIAAANPATILALLDELESAQKTLRDLRWRIEDTSAQLTERRGGDGESFYGLDEWSVPIRNLACAVQVIDAAIKEQGE